MTNRERLLLIIDFLKPYQRIWQNEIMLLYPNHLEDYPINWIEELAQFKNENDLIQIEKKEVRELLKNQELLNFYKKIEELTTFPKIIPQTQLPVNAKTFLNTIPKKQHEIRLLAPIVHELSHKYELKRVIDLGGGIGLLAQALNHHYQMPVTSIDLDPALQETGRKRNLKLSPHKNFYVDYQNLRVDEKHPDFMKFLGQETLTLGLHTCGNLANIQIRASSLKKSRLLINFGCCYQKLHQEKSFQNISQFTQNHESLEMNLYALTLASRAHKKMDVKDLTLKTKVKNYRYALYVFLYDQYQISGLVNLGNSPAKLYDESFSTYCKIQFERMGLKLKHSMTELDQFYNEPVTQKVLQEMIAAGYIRNALGRMLESYILLDRVIYLEEQGYEARIMSFFNEEISPRNLGIMAHL